jgi:hypothetical protein
MTTRRCPHSWTAFQDCLELHKLMVFTADAAKRQWFYIQKVVPKPQRATAHQHILCMGVFNDYVKYLPTLKDSLKAGPVTKKRNISFSEADLAAILLVSILMMWQNQYTLIHLTKPESASALLPDLEAIKWVMVGKQSERLKAKGKASIAYPDAKSNPKRKASGGLGDQVSKKVCSEKFCQRCKVHGVPYQTHNTSNCRCSKSMVSPLGRLQTSTLSPRSPSRSLGVIRNGLYADLMQKPRKFISLRNVRSVSVTLVAVLIASRKLGAAMRILV